MTILRSLYQTKPICELGREFDKNNAYYMKFGRNQVTNGYGIVSTSTIIEVEVILNVAMLSVHRTNPIFKFGREIDKSD